jgi:hypothetical protein
MIRKGSRETLLACRGRSARGVADVVATSYGRGAVSSTSTAFLDQAEREMRSGIKEESTIQREGAGKRRG